MRIFIISLLAMAMTGVVSAQSSVKVKMEDRQKIRGEWLGMEDGQYLVGQENGSVIYIPQEVVYKLKIYKAAQDFPRYDENRNTWMYGWSGDLSSTLGQENQNFKGAGINIFMGYDWNHKYSLEASAGFRNMNIGLPETFLPVTLTAKKYLTQGRYLFFTGIEAGYQWGIENKWHNEITNSIWHTIDSNITWFQPRHTRGHGPSLTPMIGVRKIGKYGFDHVFSLGLHLQKFTSHQIFDEEPYSTIDIFYKRWRVSYGMVF